MKKTTRKLIKQGGGGCTIYVPKKWLDSKKLKPGDKLDIEEKGSLLVIGSPKQGKTKLNIKINENNKKELKNILTHSYRKGFDKIIFENTNKEINKEIEDVARNGLLGFEISDKTDNSCTIEDISTPDEEKYETILKRVFFIVKETHNIIDEDFKEKNLKNMPKLKELMINQDKYILFCKRIISKEMNKKENPLLQWELLTFLMHIEHAYYYLYKYAVDKKIIVKKEMVELLEELNQYFDMFYNAFYHRKIEYIHKLNKEKQRLHFGDIYKHIENAKGKDSGLYSHLREIFRIIQIGSSPILAELLEEEI